MVSVVHSFQGILQRIGTKGVRMSLKLKYWVWELKIETNLLIVQALSIRDRLLLHQKTSS